MENLDFNSLHQLLDNKQIKQFRELINEMQPIDVALFLGELAKNRSIVVFRMLAKEQAAEVFACLEVEQQEHIINSITDTELSEIVEELFVDDVVDMLEELPANVVKRVLRNATMEQRNTINVFLRYSEESAGSIMTAEFVDLKKRMTVAQAFDRIRRIGADKETIYTCYVTSDNRELLGVVTVKDLLLASPDEVIADIMDTHVISGTTTDDQELIADLCAKYDLLAVPIVDHENRLVGIVTVDDILDIVEEEATEDIEKMAAISPSDKPYLKTSVFDIWKARIPWLLLLMISATFTGRIIQSFETALAAQVALTAFIPMLMDTAGNSGSQAAVTIIRGLTLNEIVYADIFRIIWKELRISLACGATLAVANFAKMMIFDRLGIPIALVVCLTLATTVVMAKLVGCCLPIVAKRLGFDPAVMSSPFITTIVDALSLLIYFRFASMLLHMG